MKVAEYYGMGRIIREMGYYPRKWALCISTDHGPSQDDEALRFELTHKYPVILFHSMRRTIAWRSASARLAFCSGSPFAFYRRKNQIRISKNAIGTLAFHTHSTDQISVKQQIFEYIEELNSLPEIYQPVEICMYYKDVEKGLHLEYLSKGFVVHTAGHIQDINFVENFYNILKNFRYTTSNSFGSHAFYSVEMGLPFFIYGKKPIRHNCGDSTRPQGDYDLTKISKQYASVTDLFSNVRDSISHEQAQVTIAELGLEDSLNRSQLAVVLYYSLIAFYFKNLLSGLKKKIKILINS
ncbi:hypothetical protein [Peredibacter starrii]|uniref:Uncharacterized protein n=1 Tax=Peredibacter starrii TaxID=28202 RepID=A0AAX4HR66_9BACT|nr:hypothetical protein [Peredibacter starrii]WPU65839.1 hypothetical protein SOO65_03685 [Peredibacter starrii]